MPNQTDPHDEVMSVGAFRWANLALAFALELCALAALVYWGVHLGEGTLAKTALGVGAPLVAAILWGIFAAPRAPVSVPVLTYAAKTLVFGTAAAALAATGHGQLAIVFLCVVFLNLVLLHQMPRR